MLVKLKIKYIQTLGQKKFREEEGVFIAEGPKLVAELIQSGNTRVKEIFALDDWISENQNIPAETPVTAVTVAELERISQLSSPNKVLAIVQQFDIPESVETKGKITLVLDNIQDPGNLGTIIRIADWFAVEQIICSEDTADVYNPKVVQATMGSIARVKLIYTELREWLKDQRDISIYGATLDGTDVTSVGKITEGIFLFGNESKGISPGLSDLITFKITIPKKGQAESLNVAVAVGVMLGRVSF